MRKRQKRGTYVVLAQYRKGFRAAGLGVVRRAVSRTVNVFREGTTGEWRGGETSAKCAKNKNEEPKRIEKCCFRNGLREASRGGGEEGSKLGERNARGIRKVEAAPGEIREGGRIGGARSRTQINHL